MCSVPLVVGVSLIASLCLSLCGRCHAMPLRAPTSPAHALARCCREMASQPSIVRGCSVLEIGAGCGACGILAAKLGARRVVLGDYVGAVLQNLRDCVHLNAAGSGGEAAAAAGAAAQGRQAAAGEAAQGRQAAAGEAADGADWDPEDASECDSDDFDALLAEASGRGGSGSGNDAQQRQQPGDTAAWDAGAMHVRFHDWQHDVDCLSESERAALAATPGVPATTEVPPGASIDTASNECGAPGMDAQEQFDVVIGTDILYEWWVHNFFKEGPPLAVVFVVWRGRLWLGHPVC